MYRIDGLPFESRLNCLLEPEVQDMVEVQITQQYADRTALRGTFFIRRQLTVL